MSSKARIGYWASDRTHASISGREVRTSPGCRHARSGRSSAVPALGAADVADRPDPLAPLCSGADVALLAGCVNRAIAAESP